MRRAGIILWLLYVALLLAVLVAVRMASADSRTPCIGLDYTNTEHENNNWNTLDKLLCALAQNAQTPCNPPDLCDTPPPDPFDLNATDLYGIGGEPAGIVGSRNTCAVEPGAWLSNQTLGRVNLGNGVDSQATGRQWNCIFKEYDPISGVGTVTCRPATFAKLGIGTPAAPETLGNGVAQWQPVSAPGACSAAGQGATFYSIAVNALCFCDGSNWCRVDDATNCGTSDPTSCPAPIAPCASLAQIINCPVFCDNVSACPATTTTTTAAPTTTTTTTLASTTTTTGAGTTTTTTSTTSTTINFASTGWTYAQNLPALTVDRFGSLGNTGSVASGTGHLMPAHGTAQNFGVITGTTPFNQYKADTGINCGGVGPACPVWSFDLQQSNTPFDDSAYSATALHCTMNPILNQCKDVATADKSDVKDGGLLTCHATANSHPPLHTACSAELGPP